MSDAWRKLGGKRRTLARLVYQRDRATPGYVCRGAPNRACGLPIDWSVEWPDPMSKTIDHDVELQDGGAMLDVDNCWTAHLGCNSSKGASRRHERGREQRAAQSAVIIVDPLTI